MAGNRYSDEVRKEALRLHKLGRPYSEISEILGVSSKGTLSYWLSSITGYRKNSKKQLAHLARIRPLGIAAIKKRIEKRDEAVRQKILSELSLFPLRDISFEKSMLAMLYWGEGTKRIGNCASFANTDPVLCKFYIGLLRSVFKLDESRFCIRLHLHYYHKITETKKYWSDLLSVPISQFPKPYLKRRSITKKYRKNFRGICYIDYKDDAVRREIMELYKQIAEKYVLE